LPIVFVHILLGAKKLKIIQNNQINN